MAVGYDLAPPAPPSPPPAAAAAPRTCTGGCVAASTTPRWMLLVPVEELHHVLNSSSDSLPSLFRSASWKQCLAVTTARSEAETPICSSRPGSSSNMTCTWRRGCETGEGAMAGSQV